MDFSWLIDLVSGLGYPGAFLAGFLGSSSLFLAFFPSYLVIPILAKFNNWVVIGILAGLGAGVGQFLHYYIGLGGRRLIPEKYTKSMDKWERRIEKYGLLLIIVFAATPLTPDDVLWIPLGMIRYPKVKALAAAMIGKTILNLAYAYAGAYGIDMILHALSL